jgi:hypothetical protein
MQTHRHLKLALMCTVALALPVSAGAAGIADVDGPPAKHHKVFRHVCPVNNPDYTGPKPTRR